LRSRRSLKVIENKKESKKAVIKDELLPVYQRRKITFLNNTKIE
jgi:hypothetical protein